MKKSVVILLVSILVNATFSLCLGQTTTPQGNDKKALAKTDQQPQSKQQPAKTEKVVYTCPMHPSVTSDKPGKCPECKMNLAKKDLAAVTYTCPMHKEVTQDKPGKCPQCGMNLAKKESKQKEDTKKK